MLYTPPAFKADDLTALYDHMDAAKLKGIIGFEIAIDTLEGQPKLSQNRSQADQIGVVEGLGASEKPSDRVIAELMRGLSA